MGLRMDDIHTPTVPSGPTSATGANGLPRNTLSFAQLSDEKARLEAELSALSAVLDSHGVTMDTSLTTFDGYPRDDIDVAQVRTTRARIIYLRNDYKDVLAKLDKALEKHFAETAGQAAPGGASEPRREVNTETPFARVNSVVAGSPAETAGLKTGDKVVRFGFANWLNHERLAKVAEVVSQNEGRPIAVTLLRERAGSTSPDKLQLVLTPRRDWGGRGMLGCHLVPL